jgi:multiple sugar transport system substrate-binding protein
MDDAGPPRILDQSLTRRDLVRKAAKTAAAVAAAAPIVQAETAAAAVSARRSVLKTNSVQITVWSQNYGVTPQGYQSFINDAVKAFKAKTGVEVNWQIVQWSTAFNYWNLKMSQGEVPDVADMFDLQSRVIQGRNKWGPLDITKLVNQGKFGSWNRFVPVSRQESSYANRIYAIPWRIDVRAFVYNEKLWGPKPPATIAEFEEMGKNVLAKNSGVLVAAPNLAGGFQAVVDVGATFAAHPLNPDLTGANFDDPRWKTAMTWVQKMISEDIFNTTVETDPNYDIFTPMLSGTAAASFGGNITLFSTIKGTNPKLYPSIKAAVMPAGPGTKPGQGIGLTSAAQWSVFENSKNQEPSLEFVNFITSPKVVQEMVIASGVIAADVNVQRAIERMPGNGYLKAFNQQSLLSYNIVPPSVAWAQLSAPPDGPVVVLGYDVWAGKDVASSLATAQSATNSVIAKYPRP